MARAPSADHCIITCRVANEIYIRIGGKWRHLWRAINANGQAINVRLTTPREAKAFLNKAIERVRLQRPVTIGTGKAHAWLMAEEVRAGIDTLLKSQT